ARHPSPKNSPGPSIATTASLPVFDTTDSLTPPDRMYRTCSQASPCVKIVSPRPYSTTVFRIPDESRKPCALNAGTALVPPRDAFLTSMLQACHLAGRSTCAQMNRAVYGRALLSPQSDRTEIRGY